MSNFMEGYEDVAARVRRFQIAYPVGRIETDVTWHDSIKGQVLVKAAIYREHEDTMAAAIDWAYGDITNYPQSMRKWYLEDTVTSAIGRAISLILETEKKPTQQDMAKVEYVNNKPFKEKLADKISVENPEDPWTIKTAEAPKTSAEAVDLVKDIIGGQTDKDIPNCSHGKPRVLRTGTSKAGKQWAAWDCTYKANVYQVGQEKPCEPDRIWLELSPSGTWVPQKGR
jgi:hypothetical protein